MTCCWECEATTSQPIAVTIEVPDGHPRCLQLCPTCYRMYYLPLIAEASADRVHRDPPVPPLPGARRTAPYTRGRTQN